MARFSTTGRRESRPSIQVEDRRYMDSRYIVTPVKEGYDVYLSDIDSDEAIEYFRLEENPHPDFVTVVIKATSDIWGMFIRERFEVVPHGFRPPEWLGVKNTEEAYGFDMPGTVIGGTDGIDTRSETI